MDALPHDGASIEFGFIVEQLQHGCKIMTSLIAWIAVDSRGPASVYLASDSRITWARRDGAWDYARKLFACSKHPHILGYCGDVIVPTQTLSQIVDLIDSDLFLDPAEGNAGCVAKIASTVQRALDYYPGFAKQPFDVLHCSREGEGVGCNFHLTQLSFQPGSPPAIHTLPLPSGSGVVSVLGSGAASVQSNLDKWNKSVSGGTSRAVFSAFCDSVKSGADPASGGPPQVVGIWRMFPPKTFGAVWEQRRFFYGTEVNQILAVPAIQWFNERMEICDPVTLRRRDGAQPQPRPTNL